MALLPRRRGGVWRMVEVVGPPAAVAAVAALILRLLGGVPDLLQPCPGRGPGGWDSLSGAEAGLGVPIWVPAYLPAGAAWPPRGIRCLGEAPLTIVMTMDLPGSPGAVLELTQVLGAGPSPSPRLGPSGPTEDSPVAVDGGGLLRVQRGPDGRTWREVIWTRGARRLILRGPLETDEILRTARSIVPPQRGGEGS